MSRTALVVDDALSVLEVTTMMVEDLGCHVLAASSGKEALAMLSGRHVDLLIADIDMPGMKGTDLAQEATQRWPHLKVLLVSGGATDAKGFTVLRKPFDQEKLKSVMEVTTGLC
jgi:CheY-like chemotaxis protein